MTSSQHFVVTWIECVIAGGVLLLMARLILSRVRQPADRINLILVTLSAAALVPLLITCVPVPAWHLGMVSAELAAPPAPADAAVAHRRAAPPSVSVTNGGAVPEATAAPMRFAPVDIASDAAMDRPPATVAAAPPEHLDPWRLVALGIPGVYGLASLYFLMEWWIGRRKLRRLTRAARPCGAAVGAAWRLVTAGRGAQERVLVSDEVDSPLTCGWLRPTVIVPRRIADGDATSLRFCLSHEWSHIERSDLGAWWLTWLCQYWLWCQPLYWRLRRELRVCQDILADDCATGAGRDAIEYSELLVGFARRQAGHPISGAIAFLDQPSALARRVSMLLSPPIRLRSRSRDTFCVLIASAALCAAWLVSGVRIEGARAADDSTSRPQETAQPKQLPASAPLAANVPPAATQPAPEKEEPPATPPANQAETLHYGGIVLDKETGRGIPNATVVVRRSKLTPEDNTIIEESRHTTDAEGKYAFDIPPEQAAVPWLYIELDVEHADYAAQKGFGYALSMIRKNEGLGERPFFEKVELNPSEPATGRVLSPDGRPLGGIRIQGYSKSSATDFRDYGSFTETVTDDAGRFRLNLVKGGVGVLWVLPTEFAGTSRAINADGRALGDIPLRPGVRVSGRVIDAEGHPVAGIPVEIQYQGGGSETVNNLPVATSIQRVAVTDDEGRCAFDPLPTGEYRVTPTDHTYDAATRGRARYELPGVFLPMKVTLQEGVAAAPIEVQAVPHVLFQAQYFDSKGEKTRGHECFLFGQMDGQYWFGQARPNAEGTISLRVPHGLQNVQLDLMTNEHGALRFRRGPGKELENDRGRIELGTLNDDVNGFEIIRYRAPLVLVSAVDEQQQPVKDFRVAAAYSWGQQEYVLEGELRSDLSFEHQQDGRYRTSQMLPDEDVKFTVTADGYEPVSETVRLPEGESKELVVMLKKAAAAPPE